MTFANQRFGSCPSIEKDQLWRATAPPETSEGNELLVQYWIDFVVGSYGE
jgi:hypothetical protein